MHAKNLAIVWSPNLLRPMSLDGGGAALLQVNVQAVIIEYLIRNANVFFDEHAAAAAIVANPRYSSSSLDRQRKVVSDSSKDSYYVFCHVVLCVVCCVLQCVMCDVRCVV